MTNAQGYDESHYQSSTLWEAALDLDFAINKATDGQGYTDPTFTARAAQARAGIKAGGIVAWGGYHFLEPLYGAAQADRYLGVAGPWTPGQLYLVDWEASALSSPGTLRDFCARVNAADPNPAHRRLGYCSSSRKPAYMAAVGGLKPAWGYWEADYTPPAVAGWTFLQYSDGGGNLDHDEYNGTRAALATWAGTTPTKGGTDVTTVLTAAQASTLAKEAGRQAGIEAARNDHKAGSATNTSNPAWGPWEKAGYDSVMADFGDPRRAK